jgi:hypothetical protein
MEMTSMSPASLRPLVLATATVVGAVAASLATRDAARAEGASCSAFVGGADSSKGAVPELVLSNLTDTVYTLDLTLRDRAGVVLASRDDEITLDPRATLQVDLLEQIRRDLPARTKPYAGLFSVEVRGDAPFAPETVLVHVTQYFGSRKAPKAAYVLRPGFRTNE